MSESVEDQIRHLLAQYVHAHDGENPDAVVACFTENGRLSVPSGAEPQGWRAVRNFMIEQYTRRRAANKVMKHLYTNSNIQVDGDTAHVVSDWVAYESVDTGPWTINMIGQSVDRIVRQAGKWLLAERRNIDSRFRPDQAAQQPLVREMIVTDEEQVREVLALWGQLHADKDADAWSQLWTEDGKYVNPRREEFIGRAAIRQYLVDRYNAHGPQRYIRHVFGVPFIRVQGDTAETAADYASCQCDGTQPAFIGAIGRHYSRLARRGGKWYFTEYRIVNPYE